ncbi:hypothetical protein FA95DRAFT_1581604 [Auriscalpium vulgare]|uniref:Uncharacterized protein n=1 Tax=Auriscalpium vulgare TaxID=40419 RepID=A0ACB8RZZ8_9AGAM|nr:hypothetical protein FA95DRAFT_1581604 [Auriscalpium vulgare]
MSESDDEVTLSLDSVFTEPPRPPSPEPTTTLYVRQRPATSGDWESVSIRLVGSHPLWGHYLWNASRSFAAYLDNHMDVYRDGHVLELGAGGGLPGIVAAKNGAQKVVLTDYPDAALIHNIEYNISQNLPESRRDRVAVKGYIWGQAVAPLLESLPTSGQTFDLIIMSDLIFNHSQHDALLKTCQSALATPDASRVREPSVLVFYSHHRPHLAQRDLEFFRKAGEDGWTCDEIVTERYPPMFPEDSGSEEVRATVHGWRLTRRR